MSLFTMPDGIWRVPLWKKYFEVLIIGGLVLKNLRELENIGN